MAVSQLAYIGIGVSDMAAWEGFAKDILGMEIGDRSHDGTVYLRMDEYHHRIALHPSGEDEILYVGLAAATPAAYEGGKAALKAAGVTLVQGAPEELENRRVVDFVKFESGGLPFELAIGPHLDFARPFLPGRPMSGFKTGVLGMGHVVLRTTTRDETAKLLIDALGFRISDYIGNMVFLHCNPRHHTLALQPESSNMPAAQGKKLWHFMVETNALDDVGIAFDLVTQRNIPLATDLGKHTNDHMISFYVMTPSGFEVEYGWGGRLIDDAVWQVVRHRNGNIWGHRSRRAPVREPLPVGATHG
jgi:2,3-dihydroxybiphenyl 1,2-dioxygenase